MKVSPFSLHSGTRVLAFTLAKESDKMTTLSEHEIKELREVFDLMDRDRGGALGGEEVKQLMEMLGMKVRDDEIEALIAEVDKDGSGEIDFEEFLLVMSKPKELPFSKQDVIRAFKLLANPDDPEGLITPETLEKALLKYCSHKVPEDEILRLLHNMDANPQGYINYMEKINMYMSK
ncbi:hypothetical protein CEUSTIGMA_g5852.t1 [Chlamydomonas eustigma]|uniref:EF-hand domain-containing protein n=1 Tax=Chlamydomonas eustigma TaxID=1157962 RepID=A0A250X6L7_9CHLO|nr:hypothetical protein CEUSTIGMA_g5852.t1 [Chlamydomonas eustigma]|eukprot:GAX78410.1 hypothetical protein CEUSTIGMA_g5852.t1 [Chlamydomonas eustigma]